MTPASQPYRCTVCDAAWSYEAVQYVACCPACGGTLLHREEAPRTQPGPSSRRRHSAALPGATGAPPPG
jgi:predicted RNA-binding Zn-ribbon protein involved in translation (DUF1610 family)